MLDCVIDCRKWSIKEKSQQPDSVEIVNKLLNLGEFNWSAKGVAGTKILTIGIKQCLR